MNSGGDLDRSEARDDAPAIALPESIEVEIRALPRWKAPTGPGAALTWESVRERLDESRLDAKLASEEAWIRALVAQIPSGRSGIELAFPAFALRSAGGEHRGVATVARPARRLRFIARAAALAAAAALVATATLTTRSARGDRGDLASQTATLSERSPIEVRVVRLGLGAPAPMAVRVPRGAGGP